MGELLTTHFIFQELWNFFRTSEVLKAAKKEIWVQARWVSTTLLATSPTNTINPELLQDFGFDPEKAPATVLPALESISEIEDSKLDSDQESVRTGSPWATTVQYFQPCPKATETGQAGKKCCPSLKNPPLPFPLYLSPGHFIFPLTALKQTGLITCWWTWSSPAMFVQSTNSVGLGKVPQGIFVPPQMSHHCLSLRGISPRPWNSPYLCPQPLP